MTTPEEIAARREATEQPKPETTGVFDTFVHPCLMCGTTVHVVDGQAQPHECADLPAGDNLAYAWWQGYDTAQAAVKPKPAVEWLGESVQAQQDDLRAILDALGISTHARPYSPHEVVQREVLPAVRDLAAVERERDELRAEVERIKGYAESGVAAEAKAVRQLESEVERVRKERDEYADRLSVLLCDLTNGRLSKPTYDVRTMVQEIEQVFSEELEADAEARAEKAEATVARVEALMDGADPAFGAVTLAAVRAALDGGDDE